MSGKRTTYQKLNTACWAGNYKAVEEHLKGMDNFVLEQAITFAVYKKHFKIVKLLIEHNAPITETILIHAKNDSELFNYLTNEIRKRKLKVIDETY